MSSCRKTSQAPEMLSFFRHRKAIRGAAEALVLMISTHLAPNAFKGEDDRHALALIRRVAEQSKQFTHGKKLGYFAKAYLTNKVKWGLHDLSYPNEFIEMVTFAMVMSFNGNQ